MSIEAVDVVPLALVPLGLVLPGGKRLHRSEAVDVVPLGLVLPSRWWTASRRWP